MDPMELADECRRARDALADIHVYPAADADMVRRSAKNLAQRIGRMYEGRTGQAEEAMLRQVGIALKADLDDRLAYWLDQLYCGLIREACGAPFVAPGKDQSRKILHHLTLRGPAIMAEFAAVQAKLRAYCATVADTAQRVAATDRRAKAAADVLMHELPHVEDDHPFTGRTQAALGRIVDALERFDQGRTGAVQAA